MSFLSFTVSNVISLRLSVIPIGYDKEFLVSKSDNIFKAVIMRSAIAARRTDAFRTLAVATKAAILPVQISKDYKQNKAKSSASVQRP